MNRQKLISVLQSRIAKRKYEITSWWKRYSVYKSHTSQSAKTCAERVSIIARELGVLQKQDKAILKQLMKDERRINQLCICAATLQSRIDTLLGWKK